MAKEKLPLQKYDLISISKLGTANSTPLICEHCGRVIFNIATLRGADSKSYVVGLTCLKKILKANAAFLSVEDTIRMQQQETAYNHGTNALKWITKTMAEYDQKCVKYRLEVYNFKGHKFWITAKLTAPYRMYSEGFNIFHTATLDACTLPMFAEILKTANNR